MLLRSTFCDGFQIGLNVGNQLANARRKRTFSRNWSDVAVGLNGLKVEEAINDMIVVDQFRDVLELDNFIADYGRGFVLVDTGTVIAKLLLNVVSNFVTELYEFHENIEVTKASHAPHPFSLGGSNRIQPLQIRIVLLKVYQIFGSKCQILEAEGL